MIVVLKKTVKEKVEKEIYRYKLSTGAICIWFTGYNVYKYPSCWNSTVRWVFVGDFYQLLSYVEYFIKSVYIEKSIKFGSKKIWKKQISNWEKYGFKK